MVTNKVKEIKQITVTNKRSSFIKNLLHKFTAGCLLKKQTKNIYSTIFAVCIKKYDINFGNIRTVFMSFYMYNGV